MQKSSQLTLTWTITKKLTPKWTRTMLKPKSELSKRVSPQSKLLSKPKMPRSNGKQRWWINTRKKWITMEVTTMRPRPRETLPRVSLMTPTASLLNKKSKSSSSTNNWLLGQQPEMKLPHSLLRPKKAELDKNSPSRKQNWLHSKKNTTLWRKSMTVSS